MIEAPKTRRLRLEEFNQLWVAEYSVEQNAFSVKDVNEMLETNRLNLSRRLSVDYLPIAFTPSRDAAIALSNDLRDNLDQQRDRQAKYESDNADGAKNLNRLLEFSEDKLWALFRKLDPRPLEGQPARHFLSNANRRPPLRSGYSPVCPRHTLTSKDRSASRNGGRKYFD